MAKPIDEPVVECMNVHPAWVPRRMFGGVPTTDACLFVVTPTGDQPLQLQLPSYPANAVTNLERRAPFARASNLIFWHDLYPLVPPLEMSELDSDVWRASEADQKAGWMQTLWDAGYTQMQTSAADYAKIVPATTTSGRNPEVRLFGEHHNPLRATMALVQDEFGVDVLTHYIFSVTMQYYLFVRQGWLEVRTDPKFDGFNEALPPHLFALSRHIDLRSESLAHYETYAPLSSLQGPELEARAANHPLPHFFWSVCQFIKQHHSDWFGPCNLPTHLSNTFIKASNTFIHDKLHKNFMQTLTTMRFREVLPINIVERAQQSMQAAGTFSSRSISRLTTNNTKFFPRPQACKVKQLIHRDGAAEVLGLVPYFMCHMFFSPSVALVRADVEHAVDKAKPSENGPTDSLRRSHLQWMMRLYFPLSAANAQAKVDLWRLPRDAVEKYFEYDAYIQLSPVRARYSFFIDNNLNQSVLLYVPNLMLPFSRTNLPIGYNERSLQWMSPSVFQWCCARGRTLNMQHASALIRRSPTAEWQKRMMHTVLISQQQAVVKPWLVYSSLTMILDSEEDACATAAEVYKLTLEQIRADFNLCVDAMLNEAWSIHEQIPDLLAEWDRCSPVLQLPASVVRRFPNLQLYLHFLCPPAVIPMNGQPWVQSWLPHRPLPELSRIVSVVCAQLSNKKLQPYLKASLADEFLHIDERNAEILKALLVISDHPLITQLYARYEQQQQLPPPYVQLQAAAAAAAAADDHHYHH
jgi:hypothetical protein